MNTTEPIEKLYFTVSETAQLLRVTPYTIRKWCREGVIPSMKANKGQYLIHKLDIPAFARKENHD